MKKIIPLSFLLTSILFAQNNFSGNTITTNESIVINQATNTNKSENLTFTFSNKTTNSKVVNNASNELFINCLTDYNKESNETKMTLSLKNLTQSKINLSKFYFKINSTNIDINQPDSLNSLSEFNSNLTFSFKKVVTDNNVVEINIEYN